MALLSNICYIGILSFMNYNIAHGSLYVSIFREGQLNFFL